MSFSRELTMPIYVEKGTPVAASVYKGALVYMSDKFTKLIVQFR